MSNIEYPTNFTLLSWDGFALEKALIMMQMHINLSKHHAMTVENIAWK